MKGTVTLVTVTILMVIRKSHQHAKLMEPPSRSSMWRVGFPTPKNPDDNALYCGGYGVQHDRNGGRCGICGDPWHVYPRPNEAPHGIYATGIIVKTYRQGSIIPVVIDITANHQGYFQFKLCPNNDIWQDPGQECFDRHVLRTGKKARLKYPIDDHNTGLRMMYVRLPQDVECSQCILQWTWVAGNNWGICKNGTGDLGCGSQETFRACSDIRIVPHGQPTYQSNKLEAFDKETAFDLDKFEDYYDYLFPSTVEEKYKDFDYNYQLDKKPVTQRPYGTKKMLLLKKKLMLARALKKLKQLIILSKMTEEDEEKRRPKRRRPSETGEDLLMELLEEPSMTRSTVVPWWARRTNSHGRKKRFSFLTIL